MTDQQLVFDLKRQISRDEIVIILGTGVTSSVSDRSDVTSWPGLLKSGIDRCMSVGLPVVDGKWKERQFEALTGDLVDVLGVAQQVETRLRAAGGEFGLWLRETLGALHPSNVAVLEAISGLNSPVSTTNYDTLAEQVLGRSIATWSDRIDISTWLTSGAQNSAVLHLHGVWSRPDTVILGNTSYQTLAMQEHLQFMQRVIAATKSLLFVGCGAGLEDPNLGALIDWLRTRFGDSQRRHYRLCLDSELPALSAQRMPNDRVFPISYGTSYKDLAPFLKTLVHWRSPRAVSKSFIDLASAYEGLTQIAFGDERWDRKNEVLNKMADIVISRPIYYDVLENSGRPGFIAALAAAICRHPRLDDIKILARIMGRGHDGRAAIEILEACLKIVDTQEIGMPSMSGLINHITHQAETSYPHDGNIMDIVRKIETARK